MNQEKIGKFISVCRHSSMMTQDELATILGVTNKSVSKWERGISMPDQSIVLKLSRILNITLDELYKGEYIDDDPYFYKVRI